jgi:hypothetical protein
LGNLKGKTGETAMRRVIMVLLIVATGVSAAAYSASPQTRDTQRGRLFYAQHVFPELIKNGCQKCHAVGDVHPNVLKYDELLPFLAMGDAPEKSDVIRQIGNLRQITPARPSHPGGQRCVNLESEPCRSIIQWWYVEFGSTKASGKGPPQARAGAHHGKMPS